MKNDKRVDEIQRRCVVLLEQKKSWEYINAMVQLKDLIDMRERYENIGAYSELINQAKMWDGKTEPDVVDTEGVKSSIGLGIGSLKSAAFAAVGDVVANGIVFDRQQNWKNRGYDTAVIVAPISIAGTEYICEVVVETRPNRQGGYLHEVEVKEKLADVFKTPTKGSTQQASGSVLALRAQEVKQLKEKVSKVVDENGEPKRVYHGTTELFDAFDMSKGRANMDIQGAFFSPWELDAAGYGTMVGRYFLNIRSCADWRG